MKKGKGIKRRERLGKAQLDAVDKTEKENIECLKNERQL